MLHELEGVKRTSSTEPTLILVDIAGYAAVFFVFVHGLGDRNHWVELTLDNRLVGRCPRGYRHGAQEA